MVKLEKLNSRRKVVGDNETVDKILSCALHEFALHSIHGVSTRQIAKKAGVNHACINYYFGGKYEMYVEILRRAVNFFNENYRELLAEIDAYLKSGTTNRKESGGYIKALLAKGRETMVLEGSESFQLLIRREESYPTDAFPILFDGVFKPLNETIVALIRADNPEISREKALAFSISLLSLNVSQLLCKTGYLKLANKNVFDNAIRADFSDIVDKTIDNFIGQNK